MNQARVSFLEQSAKPDAPWRSAVCLHGHTLHSEEHLGFLPRFLKHIPGASRFTRDVNFERAFFTPPLAPACALRLEGGQIEALGLRAMVSLTDHDNLEAGLLAQTLLISDAAPVSVEWTVPYARTIFHLGIHNLPPASARFWMSAMAGYTSAPDESRLPELLSALARIPNVLIVLNHPFWLEEGVEEAAHPPALQRLLRECLQWLHAFELNGTRKWSENAQAVELAQAHSRPIVSGGDRHGCEPSACINLTNAATFSEFACEVRDGHSSIAFLPHYRQSMTLRLFEAVCDMLRVYPEYPERRRWIDRFFYRHEDGRVESLASLWRNREPLLLRPATGTLQFLSTAGVRGALRQVFARQAEAIP